MNDKVAIGILIKNNQVYITKGKYKQNIWEFPGGKLKKDENIIHALKREILEEVGIIVLESVFYQRIKYIRCKKKITLYFFFIIKWKGEPYSREGYFYIWKSMRNLKSSHFPPANSKIIAFLKKASVLEIF
ncbi:NUDIX domain-containing protein [Buchnera aphidicola]|uniref:8-oxo-dGTP diphosphatase n=1 Tax=Buchnera aphidicola (Artemisaphis artemisicola) TaxID=1241836 RepID=A0A4D6XHH7_9GAMM|nr:NUDIX domain-containing protein [Buchnera aphidicola]QCI15892.1 NUDIX domain-containing protein [Buchnera aphidicola (Artemisaphis artemisicola)]